jgi:hypothetical protein
MTAYDDDGFAPPAPVARVVLRHPDNDVSVTGVRMLIDSGADATLLPAAVIVTLGLAGTGERYLLESFDGTTNESESVVAVLVFMGKSFKGRFLQIELDFGVIGRNVLNHLRLVLDGPALSWQELPPESTEA